MEVSHRIEGEKMSRGIIVFVKCKLMEDLVEFDPLHDPNNNIAFLAKAFTEFKLDISSCALKSYENLFASIPKKIGFTVQVPIYVFIMGYYGFCVTDFKLLTQQVCVCFPANPKLVFIHDPENFGSNALSNDLLLFLTNHQNLTSQNHFDISNMVLVVCQNRDTLFLNTSDIFKANGMFERLSLETDVLELLSIVSKTLSHTSFHNFSFQHPIYMSLESNLTRNSLLQSWLNNGLNNEETQIVSIFVFRLQPYLVGDWPECILKLKINSLNKLEKEK